MVLDFSDVYCSPINEEFIEKIGLGTDTANLDLELLKAEGFFEEKFL